MLSKIVGLLEQVLAKTKEIHFEVKEGNKKIMSGISDLNAEIASFTTSVSAEISASTAAITAALANNDTDAIEAAVANLKTLQGTVDAYTASITPAPPVTPAA